MNYLTIFALLVALTSAAPPPLPAFLKDVNNRDAQRACRQAFTPDPSQREVIQGCVDSAGLTEATLNDIRALVKDSMKQGAPGSGTGLKERILKALLDAGQAGAADKVMKCVATQKGYVVDGVFNMDAFRTELLEKATGSNVEEKIRSAVKSCPPVEGFDVPTFMKCVLDGCAGSQ